MNPQTMTRGEALAAAGSRLTPLQVRARDFVAGHHLGRPNATGGTGTEYWTGPRFEPNPNLSEAALRQSAAASADFYGALQRSFAPVNLIGRGVRRHVGTVIGREPTWTLPRASDDVAKAWWTRARTHRVLKAAVTEALTTGRGVLRLVVKPAALADGKPRHAHPQALVRFVGVESIPPEACTMWEDQHGNPAAVYRYRAQSADTEDTAELCCIDAATGETVITRYAPGTDTGEEIVRAWLGARITYVEIVLDPLATDAAIRNNQMYNMVSTMMGRNSELAGWVERWARDLEPPMVPGRDGQPTPLLKVGPGSMTLWRSARHTETDAEGNETIKTVPGEYGRFEPVSADPLVSAAEHARQGLHDEIAQTHVLMGKDATASGRSREVAMDDFAISTAPTESELNRAGTELVAGMLAIVAYLTGRSELAQEPEFRCRVRPVTPSAQDRAQYVAEQAAGVSSMETTRHLLGIEDSPAEDEQIARERAAAPSPVLTG